MKPVLEVGRSAFVKAQATQSGLLIDARDYYRTLCRALEQAQRYVIVSGWQFESGVRLLRGKDAQTTTRPVKLLELLTDLCAARPSLDIYLLAWDFSLIYAHERERTRKKNSAQRARASISSGTPTPASAGVTTKNSPW